MLQLFVGSCLIGFAPIFVKLVSTGPTTTGFYRCTFATLILALLIATKTLGNQTPFRFLKWPAEAKKLAIFAGILFGMDLFVWHRAVLYAGAGMGTILGNTQVFYASLAGILFFREKLTQRFVVAVILAFIGIFLLVSYRSATPGDHYWWGVGFGLSTGVVYASYILTLRRIESLAIGIPTEHLIVVVSAVSALTLLPVSFHEGTLRLPIGIEWLWLPLLAIVAQVAGWVMITRNLPKAPVSRASLILLMQPLVATLFGDMIFNERLSPIQMLGAAISLIAIYSGTLRSKPLITIPTAH